MKTHHHKNQLFGWAFILLLAVPLVACSSTCGAEGYCNARPSAAYHTESPTKKKLLAQKSGHHANKSYDKVGYASWYGKKFHGRRTSSDERYNMHAYTAANKTLPFNSYARVTNLKNGRSVIVRINDRGPFHANRIIDLSYAAAKELGYTSRGTTLVRVTAVNNNRLAANATQLGKNSHPPTTF